MIPDQCVVIQIRKRHGIHKIDLREFQQDICLDNGYIPLVIGVSHLDVLQQNPLLISHHISRVIRKGTTYRCLILKSRRQVPP